LTPQPRSIENGVPKLRNPGAEHPVGLTGFEGALPDEILPGFNIETPLTFQKVAPPPELRKAVEVIVNTTPLGNVNVDPTGSPPRLPLIAISYPEPEPW
jgi:hypothetical protein